MFIDLFCITEPAREQRDKAEILARSATVVSSEPILNGKINRDTAIKWNVHDLMC